VPRPRVLVALVCALGLALACLGAGNVRVVNASGFTPGVMAEGATCANPICEQSQTAAEGTVVQASPSVASDPIGLPVSCVELASCIGGGTLAIGSVLMFALFSNLSAFGVLRARAMRISHHAIRQVALPKGERSLVFRPPRFI
jgi:hypothetical protein